MRDVPRVLGDTGDTGDAGETGETGETGHRGDLDDSPILVCLGGLHGNEPCGVLALQRIFARLEQDRTALVGRLVGLAGNRRALEQGRRYLDEDLNRIWLPDVRDRASAEVGPERARELDEVQDILRVLDALLPPARSRVAFLDLHSTSGGGAAFAILDDTLANRELAFAIPVPHVLGLEEELAGTATSYLDAYGRAAISFEAGQHLDPASVDRAEAAVWIAMQAAGVLAPGERPEVAAGKVLLADQHRSSPNVVDVRYRHPVVADAGFVMAPGFVNFQPISKGRLLAHDRSGPLHAPLRGLILMPLYQGQGDDGYFIVREVNAAWLGVSAVLRRLRLGKLLHWLPGVERAPGRRQTFIVDLTRARVLALQVFHLLGYKRIGRTSTTLIMRQRDARSE